MAESHSEQRAVIGARWHEVFPELVIAYRDAESLRELIDAPSIIGIGFSSREAAVAVIPNRSSGDTDSKNAREKPTYGHEDDCRPPQSPTLRLRHSVALKETRRLACTVLQHAMAGGVLLF